MKCACRCVKCIMPGSCGEYTHTSNHLLHTQRRAVTPRSEKIAQTQLKNDMFAGALNLNSMIPYKKII